MDECYGVMDGNLNSVLENPTPLTARGCMDSLDRVREELSQLNRRALEESGCGVSLTDMVDMNTLLFDICLKVYGHHLPAPALCFIHLGRHSLLVAGAGHYLGC